MAEYTILSNDEIESLLAQYTIGKAFSHEPLKGGQANSSYKITTETGEYILAVCDEKNEVEAERLAKVLVHLESQGFPTSRVVKTTKGSSVINAKDKPAYLKKYMAGETRRRLSPGMVYQVGQTMADLHAIPPLADLPDQFPYGRQAFGELADIRHEFVQWLALKQEFLAETIDPLSKRRLIHGDIYWDNLLFEGERLAAILDFEEACCYYQLFDIGMCTVGCCASDGRFDFEKVKALLGGYQQRRPLDIRQRSEMQAFMVYAAAAGAFWRFRQYNVRHPGTGLAQSYLELSSLADQVHHMPMADFNQLFD